jgi:hypothetical protein
MNRALKEQNSDSWINGRRRDHGTTMFPDGLSSVISCTINSKNSSGNFSDFSDCVMDINFINAALSILQD